MKRIVGALLLGLPLGLLLAGCGNTLSGAKEDVSADTQGVRTATARAATQTRAAAAHAAAATKEASHNAVAASELTPRIKLAIIRDPVLNNRQNTVNVDAANGFIFLRGHVQTQTMKERATEDAQTVLDTHHATDKVKNELTVSGAP